MRCLLIHLLGWTKYQGPSRWGSLGWLDRQCPHRPSSSHEIYGIDFYLHPVHPQVFEDHSYIEIINFTHPPYYYPPGSPLRLKRDSHPWSEAYKKPGLVDFAFLGNGSLDPSKSVSSTINERAKKDGIELKYVGEKPGGRTRTDGQVLKWLISSPEKGGGVLPFFCGDITPRKLRVSN